MQDRLVWLAIAPFTAPEASAGQRTEGALAFLDKLLDGPGFTLGTLALALIALGFACSALWRVIALHRGIVEQLRDLGAAGVRAPGLSGAPASLQQVLNQLSSGHKEAHAELDGRLKALTRQVEELARSRGGGGTNSLGGLLRRPAAELQPQVAESPEAERERLLERYRQAVLDLSGAGESFLADFGVTGASSTGEGDYVAGEDARAAFIWSARLSDGSRALLPGAKAILNWAAHFAPNRGTTAQEQFGAAYELDASSAKLAVLAPAIARGEGRLRVVQRGRLTGFRS